MAREARTKSWSTSRSCNQWYPKGHMRLHAKNMAVSAGAMGDEIEIVAQRIITEEGPKTQTRVAEILEELRK